MAQEKLILFVVPAYNEGGVLERTLTALYKALTESFPDNQWHILVANNASTDDTAAIARGFVSAHHGRSAYLSIPARGRGNALREVARAYPGTTLCFLDADLPLDLSELPRVLAPVLRGSAEVAVGKREGARSPIRTAMTKGWSLACHACFNLTLADPQCGVLALAPRASEVLATNTRETQWLTNTEFLIAARRAGLRITEVPVRWIEYRYPERASTVQTARYIREGLGFLINTSGFLAPLAGACGIGVAVAAGMWYQLTEIAQDGFIVAHHLPALLPAIRTHALVLGAAFGILAVPLFRSFRKIPWRVGLGTLLFGVVGLWSIAVATPPTRSQDAYWNLAFGKIAGIYGENPYRTPPGVLTDDPWTDLIHGFKDLTLTHGPLWAMLMAGIAALSGGSLLVALALSKFVMLAALLAGGWVLWRTFDARGVPREERVARMALVAWSPFLMQVALVDTHNDVLMSLGILASYYLALRGRYGASALALVGTGFVKYVSFLLVPIPIFLMVKTCGIRAALRRIVVVTAISTLLAVALYLPFGPPWENAGGLARQVFGTVSFRYATVPSLASAALVGPYGVWYFGITLALATLAWYLLKGNVLRAYAAPLLSILATGTLWLQSWYLLWGLPLFALALSPALIAAYLTLGFLVPEGMSTLSASVIGLVFLGVRAIKQRGSFIFFNASRAQK